ncbi:MAG TPA: DASS family sodium-coupled anion symporter [Phycisphaerae bacterium]|nr:DASS family sodium-coupled anion symporter [Phycisphaerae bacterium]HNU45736.1 DASS family sodium-coupled anion symporter [Phycisphaerae bacterium]
MPTPLRVKFTRQRVVIDLSFATAFKTLLCLAVAVAAGYLPIPGLEQAAPRICFVIFVAAAALWITELIPPYATSVMVIVTCVYLLGLPRGPLHLEGTGQQSWQMFLNPVASPVLILFFGGFVLAKGATKHGFDVRLARAFITPFGNRPSLLLLGVILTTALFSLFMSNTATTAMMIAIVAPMLTQLGSHDRAKKMLVLAVPFAANIGGIGTIIGTPPNAVAASILQQLGPDQEITFLGWMLFGVPIAVVLLLLLWGVLLLVYRPGKEALSITFPDTIEVTPGLAIVVCTFTLTVLLWLTEPLHGLPTAVVAMLPIAVFTAFNIINREDLQDLDWDVMILVAGGMTLGVAMKASGLSDIIVRGIPFAHLPLPVLLAAVALVSITLSNFMSHTAASNLVIPIVIALSGVSPKLSAVAVALASSLAMSLPISTPPNAIAFATRAVTTRDMALYGTLVSALGLGVVLSVLILGAGLMEKL